MGQTKRMKGQTKKTTPHKKGQMNWERSCSSKRGTHRESGPGPGSSRVELSQHGGSIIDRETHTSSYDQDTTATPPCISQFFRIILIRHSFQMIPEPPPAVHKVSHILFEAASGIRYVVCPSFLNFASCYFTGPYYSFIASE